MNCLSTTVWSVLTMKICALKNQKTFNGVKEEDIFNVRDAFPLDSESNHFSLHDVNWWWKISHPILRVAKKNQKTRKKNEKSIFEANVFGRCLRKESQRANLEVLQAYNGISEKMVDKSKCHELIFLLLQLINYETSRKKTFKNGQAQQLKVLRRIDINFPALLVRVASAFRKEKT